MAQKNTFFGRPKFGLSFSKEIYDIRNDLKQLNVSRRLRGFYQYKLLQRDCFDFMNSNANDRMIFAEESGLIQVDKS
jgi:hypothetical protein